MTDRWPALLLMTLALYGCEPEEHCNDYVDYMCDCHADDPGFDCEELRAELEKASADVQDQCALDLDNQKDVDADDTGIDCEV